MERRGIAQPLYRLVLRDRDWRNLVGAYLDEASAAVTGLGGHVLKKLGDGLNPQAQENDAERRAWELLTGASAIQGSPHVIGVQTTSGEIMHADLVVDGPSSRRDRRTSP